jgi:hypothetical protein
MARRFGKKTAVDKHRDRVLVSWSPERALVHKHSYYLMTEGFLFPVLTKKDLRQPIPI